MPGRSARDRAGRSAARCRLPLNAAASPGGTSATPRSVTTRTPVGVGSRCDTVAGIPSPRRASTAREDRGQRTPVRGRERQGVGIRRGEAQSITLEPPVRGHPTTRSSPAILAATAVAGAASTARTVPSCVTVPLSTITSRSARAAASTRRGLTAMGREPREALPQHRADLRRRHGVERDERLVEQDHPGSRGEGPGDRDALLLSARQPARGGGLPAREPDTVEPLVGAGSGDGCRDPRGARPEGDVLARGEVREEPGVLPEEHDSAVHRGGAQARRPVEHAPVVRDLAPVQRGEAGEGV